MAKKIGFSMDSDRESESDKKKDGEGPLGDIFGVSFERTSTIISGLFSPEGPANVSEFMTTVDIQCRIEGIITVSKSTLYKVLESLGFRIRFIGGFPYWMVFPLYDVDSE